MAIPTKGRKKTKKKETKFELVKRPGANPLSWIGKKYKKTPESEVRRYGEARPGYKGRKTTTGTQNTWFTTWPFFKI